MGLLGTFVICFEDIKPFNKLNYLIPGFASADIAIEKVRNKEKLDKDFSGFNLIRDIIKKNYLDFNSDIIAVDDYHVIYGLGGLEVIDTVKLTFKDKRSKIVTIPYLLNSLSEYKHKKTIHYGIFLILIGFVFNVWNTLLRHKIGDL